MTSAASSHSFSGSSRLTGRKGVRRSNIQELAEEEASNSHFVSVEQVSDLLVRGVSDSAARARAAARQRSRPEVCPTTLA